MMLIITSSERSLFMSQVSLVFLIFMASKILAILMDLSSC